MSNMETDIFAEQVYGKIALKKMSNASPNFKLFEASRVDKWGTIRVRGGEFRAAKRGPDAGRLSILIPGTTQVAYVTPADIREFDNG